MCFIVKCAPDVAQSYPQFADNLNYIFHTNQTPLIWNRELLHELLTHDYRIVALTRKRIMKLIYHRARGFW